MIKVLPQCHIPRRLCRFDYDDDDDDDDDKLIYTLYLDPAKYGPEKKQFYRLMTRRKVLSSMSLTVH